MVEFIARLNVVVTALWVLAIIVFLFMGAAINRNIASIKVTLAQILRHLLEEEKEKEEVEEEEKEEEDTKEVEAGEEEEEEEGKEEG